MSKEIEKIPGTIKNWENRVLGCDERYVARADINLEDFPKELWPKKLRQKLEDQQDGWSYQLQAKEALCASTKTSRSGVNHQRSKTNSMTS